MRETFLGTDQWLRLPRNLRRLIHRSTGPARERAIARARRWLA